MKYRNEIFAAGLALAASTNALADRSDLWLQEQSDQRESVDHKNNWIPENEAMEYQLGYGGSINIATTRDRLSQMLNGDVTIDYPINPDNDLINVNATSILHLENYSEAEGSPNTNWAIGSSFKSIAFPHANLFAGFKPGSLFKSDADNHPWDVKANFDKQIGDLRLRTGFDVGSSKTVLEERCKGAQVQTNASYHFSSGANLNFGVGACQNLKDTSPDFAVSFVLQFDF